VARIYAGILGLVAFLTCLAHGLLHGSAVASLLGTACACLAAFAALGGVLGWLAMRTVEESVYRRLQTEMTATQPAHASPAPAARAEK